MSEHDNFCLADSMARANGWSLGQQWGFAAFMNDCDRAAAAANELDEVYEVDNDFDEDLDEDDF